MKPKLSIKPHNNTNGAYILELTWMEPFGVIHNKKFILTYEDTHDMADKIMMELPFECEVSL